MRQDRLEVVDALKDLVRHMEAGAVSSDQVVAAIELLQKFGANGAKNG